MKTKKLLLVAAIAATLIPAAKTHAQSDFLSHFTKLKLEARADFDYFHDAVTSEDPAFAPTADDLYGLHGCYFNLLMGGNLTDHFSYYFRQRIVAKPGSVNHFDNTDFLYIDYHPNERWSFRAGKDALAVGGFEYDAPPIDVFFFANYWDNFYCFQPAVSMSYKPAKNHKLTLQLSNSPYVHFDLSGANPGSEWSQGLFGYNLFWAGDFGHFKTLYSYNLFQRTDRDFLGYLALGNQVVFDRWDLYVDLMHHNLATDDWGKNYALVSRLNYHVTSTLNLFAKGIYEQNHSDVDLLYYGATSGSSLDCFVEAGHDYCTGGLGFEYRPAECQAVRIHGFVARRAVGHDASGYRLLDKTHQASLGITWDMDMLKLARR